MSLPVVGFAAIGPVAILAGVLLDNSILTLLGHLENIGSLFLFVAVAATLLWFAYWVLFRRVFRAWRISRIRSRRLLSEAARRGRA